MHSMGPSVLVRRDIPKLYHQALALKRGHHLPVQEKSVLPGTMGVGILSGRYKLTCSQTGLLTGEQTKVSALLFVL